ncbi:MAG: DJ-1/PfpI family protein [Peptostreptococcaceae bacterium]|nr:DJ-1/PfpI family protein [Peptostreptococcaceae bacterium]
MVYIHLAEGFEEIEALTIADILIRGDVDARLVSITQDKTVTGAHGIKVIANQLITESDYSKCLALILPGGMPGTLNLADSELLISHIKDFSKSDHLLAAICAAPMVFAEAGILKGKRATIYPGMEAHLIDSDYVDEKVVTDGNIVTSKGPGTAIPFALEVLKLLKGTDVYEAVKSSLAL